MRVKKAVGIFVLIFVVGILASDSDATEKLDLKLRLKPGQKYAMRLITELKRTKTIEDRQEHESFMFARGIEFDVKQVDANGVASIKVTFLTLQIDVIRAGGVHVEYDSTKQSIADDYSKIPATEAVGVGESFEMMVTPKGRIIKLKGVEQMHSRMIDKINAWDEKFLRMVPCAEKETSSISKTDQPAVLEWKDMSQRSKKRWNEMRRHNTKSNYSEKEIKNMLNDMIMAFPDRPLAIGDTWTDKVKIWGKNQIDGTYRLKGSEKGTIVIDLSANRTPEEEAFSWVNNEGRKVGFKIVGFCEGRFEIDQKTGWLVRSKVNMRFTGKVIDDEVNDQMPKPIVKEEVITVEPIKVE